MLPARSLPAPATPSRRAVVTGLAVSGLGVLGLSGCTADPADRSEGRGPAQPALDPDVTVATLALASLESTRAQAAATLERHPRLAAVLEPLIAVHDAHVNLLDDAVPSRRATGSATPTPSPSPSPTVEVSRRQRRALLAMAEAEAELKVRVKRHSFVAESGAFARLLAGIAAAAAQQAVLLTEAARNPDGSTP